MNATIPYSKESVTTTPFKGTTTSIFKGNITIPLKGNTTITFKGNITIRPLRDHCYYHQKEYN